MRVMMIGAHPEDAELRGAGYALKLLKAGHEVSFLILCNGCKGHHIMTMEETRKARAIEAENVRRHLGLTNYTIWDDMDDCTLEVTLENRRRLIRDIRAFAPDLVITHRPNDYHADHRAAGQLVQDASYMLIVPNDVLEMPAMRKMPVIAYFEDSFTSPTPFRPDVLVNIDEEIDVKIDSMLCSPSQFFEWLPYSEGEDHLVPEDEGGRKLFVRRGITEGLTDADALAAPGHYYALWSARTAAKFRKELISRYGESGRNIRFTEAFEICEYGKIPTPEELKAMFFL